MIRKINIKSCQHKHNFIDHNGIVCGFDMERQCCEDFKYAVYDAVTRENAAESPDGMPYHFAYDSFKFVDQGSSAGNWDFGTDRAYFSADGSFSECDDIFQVTMLPDAEGGRIMIFECVNCHNGYYYHDFSIEKTKSPAERILDEDISGIETGEKPLMEELMRRSGRRPETAVSE